MWTKEEPSNCIAVQSGGSSFFILEKRPVGYLLSL